MGKTLVLNYMCNVSQYTSALILTAALFLFAPKVLNAQIYYVDATNGSDSNDGISMNTAWKTIAKVNASTFQHGDNISIKEADVTYNNSADDTAIHYNATQNSSVVNLGTQKFCDLDNNVIEGSFSLATYASQILLACFNNNDGKCNNRESHATAPNDCVPGEYGEFAIPPAAPKGLRMK